MPKTGLSKREFSEKCMDKAEMLICRFGADKFTLTDLSKELNISHAALYKYFTSKEELLDTISKRWLDAIDSGLENISGSNKSAKNRIISWFRTLYRLKSERIKNNPELYSAFQKSASLHRPFVELHLKTAMKQLVEIIQSGINSKEFDFKIGANEAAELLFEATIAYHHPGFIRDNIDLDRSSRLKKLLEVLINGLK